MTFGNNWMRSYINFTTMGIYAYLAC
jgi:hypothetical protein